MKDKRPPKTPAPSRNKRPSDRKDSPVERHPRETAKRGAQSKNDRRKANRTADDNYPRPSAKTAPRPESKASRPAPRPALRPASAAAHENHVEKKPRAAAPKPFANLQGGLWLYGRHAVAAALANPDRKIRRVFATRNAADWLTKSGASAAALAKLENAAPEEIDALFKDGAVHQGLAALAEPLKQPQFEEACEPAKPDAPVLVLDQITDPQNIGALFRSAAAFGARALIVQDRRTPPLSGALAKAAAGAVEKIPCIEVVNIARAVTALQEMGYFCAGLAGEAETDIAALPAAPLALVMGAEGDGLRRLVAEKCDQLFRIPISARMESLNVSNAAAISLYEARRPR